MPLSRNDSGSLLCPQASFGFIRRYVRRLGMTKSAATAIRYIYTGRIGSVRGCSILQAG